jgi:hypothetical protein
MTKIMGMNAYPFTLKTYDGNVYQVYILNAPTLDDAIIHSRLLMNTGKGVTFFQVHSTEMLNVHMSNVRTMTPH